MGGLILFFFESSVCTKTICSSNSSSYLAILMFLPSLSSCSLSLVMKKKLGNETFFSFLPPSQYKFRDLTIEELKNVNKTYPNFTFSMNTYSKKLYSCFELTFGILTCYKFILCMIQSKQCDYLSVVFLSLLWLALKFLLPYDCFGKLFQEYTHTKNLISSPNFILCHQ